MNVKNEIKKELGKEIYECDNFEIYRALIKLSNTLSLKRKRPTGKKLYYISAEFLIGKMLSNNLINLGIYDEVDSVLKENGKSIAQIEDIENEPSLGNGGLGRLAACFLDSVSTLGLCGDGVGLLYHFGLFRQSFEGNSQKENPDKWLGESSVLIETDTKYKVEIFGKTLFSKMYDILIPGYEENTNVLHLFDLETADESIVNDSINFNKTDIEKNLTLFLYPDDSDENGKMLRIYQQYFMVSSAAQLIIEECKKRGSSLYDLNDYAVVQINDTHPSMIIPELIRLLCENGMELESAIETVRKTCAYTNHTIMAEALEKWHLDSIRKASPQIALIIEELDARVCRKFNNPALRIIDSQKRVHMANMAIHYGFSINGVAQLHTDILKKTALNDFYRVYPQKFNNKTNGVTFRRWLLKANPQLAEFITELIGDGFKKDASNLKKLTEFIKDEAVIKRLMQIKADNKLLLKEYLYKTQNVVIDENSVFDIQIKRLHEYKRQQLNALYLIDKYLEIKDGKLPPIPITAIFGAKAAPSYVIAKDIIHLILSLSELIENDSDARDFLKVVMVENYNVTKAEKLIPACDISEQISLASKEASGTGNMKLMLNGAVTLGTEDGANVEIKELVGGNNIYIFGASSDEVIEKSPSYNPKEYYNSSAKLKRAVEFITSEGMLKYGNRERLSRIKWNLIQEDPFMTLYDFDDYKKTKDIMIKDYTERMSWGRKMLVNIANAGYFSSDRTIKEYNEDIWKLSEVNK